MDGATIRIISISSKGYAMVVIHYDGKSYTRHCKPLGKGKWQGHAITGNPETLVSYEF